MYDHDWGWAGWTMMTVGMLGFWLLVALLVVVLVRTTWGGPGGSADRPPHRPDARTLLDERLARGEIDVEDHAARVAALERLRT